MTDVRPASLASTDSARTPMAARDPKPLPSDRAPVAPLVPFAQILLGHPPKLALPKGTVFGSLGPLMHGETSDSPTRVDPHGGRDGRDGRDGKGKDDGRSGQSSKERWTDPIDPSARHLAALAPPTLSVVASPSPTTGAEAPRARMSLEELLPSLVRRIAWAGDKHRGSVQLELGAGRFAGTSVSVHSDRGRVRVEVHGVDADSLRPLLDARLRRSGLDIESVT